jgi:small multidrug resistance family-3 protein
MSLATTAVLYLMTALAEIVGCYMWWLWLRQDKSAWLGVAGLAVLAIFAWLLTLHEAASGRVYAAYGGVYIGIAIAWLWVIDGIKPSIWDVAGVSLALAGMAVIVLQPAR